jgi:hypothetical protein
MRLRYFVIATLIGGFVGADFVDAQAGGLGNSPPPQVLGGIRIVEAPKPYHSVCNAPPTSCDVSGSAPIASGSDCWCEVGANYSTGSTQ